MNTIGSSKQLSVQEGEEIDLATLLNHLLDNKWLILFVTLCTLSFAVIYANRQVSQYQSDVLLQVDSSKSGIGKGGFAEQLTMGGNGMSSNSVATQIALIQSRFILEPVVQLLGLNIGVIAQKSSFWQRLMHPHEDKKTINIQAFTVPQKQQNHRFQLFIDKPRHVVLFDINGQRILQGTFGAQLSNPNKTIQLFVKSIHAPVGTSFSLVKFSNTRVVQSLLGQLRLEESGGKSYQGTGIVSMSLKGTDPTQVIHILNAIAQTAKDQDAKKKSQEASLTLKFLYQQLPITKMQLEKAEYSLNHYRAQSGKIDIKLQTQFLLNQLSGLDKKLGELRINKIDMLQRYTPEHPAFIALDTQTKALAAQRHKLENVLKTLPESDQIAVNLQRDVAVKRTLYLILLNKIQELQVVKAGTISGIRILASAKLPDGPLPHRRASIYFGGVLFGLMLSAMIIFARRSFSPRVEDPQWTERQFNLPNLAVVPYCKEQSVDAIKMDKSKQIPLLAALNPKNLAIEALRSLRTSLQVSMVCASNNMVSILGVSPGVGKSFISVNLAYLLASAGKKVLLIDADLRRGTVHKYMNIPPSPGLADVLNETISIDSAMASTPHEYLFCLPRGTYPSDPSELLMSPRFQELLQSLSQQFDVVVIDTAPVLLVTDAVLVSGISGTNYIVFGAGAHQPEEIEVALKRLTGAGVQLQGSIFNFHKEQSRKTSYGKYYNYNYNYYYDESMKN